MKVLCSLYMSTCIISGCVSLCNYTVTARNIFVCFSPTRDVEYLPKLSALGKRNFHAGTQNTLLILTNIRIVLKTLLKVVNNKTRQATEFFQGGFFVNVQTILYKAQQTSSSSGKHSTKLSF